MLPPKKVLVSFGGEDREGLSGKLLERLIQGKIFTPRQITVVEGPLFGVREWPEGITIVRTSSGLGPMISDFDLVMTHFGITAFESLAAGVPVILSEPEPLPRKTFARRGHSESRRRCSGRGCLKKLLARPGRAPGARRRR